MGAGLDVNYIHDGKIKIPLKTKLTRVADGQSECVGVRGTPKTDTIGLDSPVDIN